MRSTDASVARARTWWTRRPAGRSGAQLELQGHGSGHPGQQGGAGDCSVSPDRSCEPRRSWPRTTPGGPTDSRPPPGRPSVSSTSTPFDRCSTATAISRVEADHPGPSLAPADAPGQDDQAHARPGRPTPRPSRAPRGETAGCRTSSRSRNGSDSADSKREEPRPQAITMDAAFAGRRSRTSARMDAGPGSPLGEGRHHLRLQGSPVPNADSAGGWPGPAPGGSRRADPGGRERAERAGRCPPPLRPSRLRR